MEKVGKKGKKKQAKVELDRQKQAEKKRRRLEKALATSAAIRSELEKKKQKKIEEQQRLDKEGAAIAEAVALHVLSGEDTEESHHIVLSNDEIYDPPDHSGNLGLFTGYQSFAYTPQVVYVREMQSPFYDEACQAVGLLQIADDSQGAVTFFINKMLRGDFFKEF